MEEVKNQQTKQPKQLLEDIRTIVSKACAGLQYIDDLGFIHGDVQPKNIMWNPYVILHWIFCADALTFIDISLYSCYSLF